MDAAVEKAAEGLRNKVGLIRKTAARRLGELADRDAVPALIDALGDPDGEVREEVARSLGKLKDERAVAALERLEEDERAPVRRAARTALEAIARGGAESAHERHPKGGRGSSERDALVREALAGTGATCARTPFGYEVEIPLGTRKQRVRVIFENRDDEGDPLILVQTTCGVAQEGALRWALRQNFRFHHGHLAIRRSGTEDHFVFCRTLLEPTTQPEELRKAVLAAAAEGDRVERAVMDGRDDY